LQCRGLTLRSTRDVTAGTVSAPQSRCKRHVALPGCKDSDHHGANLGSRLTIGHRLFGPYVDPEGVGEISFGIEGAPSPTRLALGIQTRGALTLRRRARRLVAQPEPRDLARR